MSRDAGRFFDGAWQGARILGLSRARLRGGKGRHLGILRSSRRRAPASGILNVRDKFRITRAAERLHEDQPRDPARFRLRLVRQRVRPGGARSFEQERKRYVTSHAKKALGNIRQQARRVRREQHVRRGAALLLPRQREFVDLSVQVAEFIAGELGRMEKTESADLLVVDFEDDPDNTVRR
mgnify:CR=1 FL=1